MMLLKGFQKTTLLDYPGKVACTVFTGGCNFRCPFCHNARLVTEQAQEEQISEEEFFSFLKKRQGILDGVCVTGGEPLLQKDIGPFLAHIRELGFCVKLDTNGSRPDVLKQIMDAHLVDYIAMDLKNSKEKYARTCGLDAYPQAIEESIALIMQSGVEYEFRTTVVREFHSAEDMVSMAKWIQGTPRYFLQGFIDSGNLIGKGCSAYSPIEMKELLSLVIPIIPSASLRGVDDAT